MPSNKILASIKIVFFDFDGVFTDNKVYVNEFGNESVLCSRGDGIGLQRLKEAGVISYIISTESNPVVSMRAKKLKIQYSQAVQDKAAEIKKITNELGIPLNFAMFVGNDINDISAFELVGLPVAVFDSYPEINTYVKFKTKRPGGYGAVREICDMIYIAKQHGIS